MRRDAASRRSRPIAPGRRIAGFLAALTAATIEYILIPGAALAGALAAVRHLRRAVRQEPARPLFLHVPGRVRHLVLLAEHADPRGAADPDRAVHGAAGAARPGHHRRRRRAADRRAVRDRRPRWRCRARRRSSCRSRWSLRRHDRRRAVDRAVGRACGTTAASTRPSPACCWSTSRSRSSTTWSKGVRDPASLNKPSTREIGAANMIGTIPGTDVHWGLVFGLDRRDRCLHPDLSHRRSASPRGSPAAISAPPRSSASASAS